MEKVKPASSTIRRRLMELLRGSAFTAKELSKALGIKEKDVIEHLPHAARSVSASGRFLVEPSVCLNCGFVFKKRERFKTPGKCPICKSEQITESKYGIR